MSALTVVFRTRSEIEANVVQGLLESHGVQSVRTAGAPPGMFPFTVSTLGETVVSVREEEGEDAVRIIEAHRDRGNGSRAVPRGHRTAVAAALPARRRPDRGALR